MMVYKIEFYAYLVHKKLQFADCPSFDYPKNYYVLLRTYNFIKLSYISIKYIILL